MEEIQKNKYRPDEITKAFVVVLVASLIGFIEIFLVKIGLIEQTVEGATFINQGIGVIIYISLFFFIFKKMNWARITFIILTILTLLIVLPVVIQELKNNTMAAISSIMQLTLYGWGIYLLLTKRTNSWFKKNNSKKE